ncbi:MAG: hypothetical protein WKF79_15140 [Nocardioides sp.]
MIRPIPPWPRLGQRVTIEATPVEYVWHFEDPDDPDGAEDLTTSDPGAAYPDLTVTHDYLRVGTVAPSVETVYAGRFRVGGGPWRAIPDTLAVPGRSVTLEIIEATPRLVG